MPPKRKRSSQWTTGPRREVFPLTDEGRAAAAQYLKDAYDAEPERWNNCPDMMDCDPWEPPAEPDTANE